MSLHGECQQELEKLFGMGYRDIPSLANLLTDVFGAFQYHKPSILRKVDVALLRE